VICDRRPRRRRGDRHCRAVVDLVYLSIWTTGYHHHPDAALRTVQIVDMASESTAPIAGRQRESIHFISTRPAYRSRAAVSLHERYSITRHNTGYPHPVVITLAYESTSALPTTTFLHDRIVALQQLFPHLYAHVVDGRTNKPAWELRPRPYAPEEILRPDQTITQLSGSSAESGQLEQALKAALASAKSTAEDETPLWQVQRYIPANDTGGTAYLAVWASHQLADGVGTLRLAQAILSRDISTLRTETSLAPKLEDSVNIEPPVTHLLPVVFQKLLLPSLPSFIQAYFKPAAPWPAERILQRPTQCEEDLLLVQIPGELVSVIKSAGASHGVRTLHPILELAYLVSIWAVFSHDKAPLLLDGQTPRNERAAEKGHGQITGNYVSSLHHQVTPSRDSSFWSLAKDCARSLTAEDGLRRGRYAMGMLAYVPDPDNFSVSPTSHQELSTSRGPSLHRPSFPRCYSMWSAIARACRSPCRGGRAAWSRGHKWSE
jgi:hypothetical protein